MDEKKILQKLDEISVIIEEMKKTLSTNHQDHDEKILTIRIKKVEMNVDNDYLVTYEPVGSSKEYNWVWKTTDRNIVDQFQINHEYVVASKKVGKIWNWKILRER